MTSVNETLRDADISHQVDLSKYSNGVVRRILALLNRTDADLFSQLIAALEQMTPETFSVERLEYLLQGVRVANASVYAQVGQELRSELRDLTQYEAQYQYTLFRTTLPQVVPVAQTTIELAYSAALARPMQGKLLSEWAQSIEAGRMARIRDTVRIGYVEGQTTSQIVQRVRGTRAKGFADGIIEMDRRHADAIVRTAISHTAATTRDRFYKDNDDLIVATIWTSTLDNRTSSICRIRDGKRYTNDTHKPIGHSIPYLSGPGKCHFCCRSTAVPQTKSYKDLGIDIEELKPSERAAMTGTVPAETTYGQWLAKQSAARQDEVLGPQRGRLMRQGGLSMDKFYNDKGQVLDLDTLRQRDAAAFAKAGL